MTPLETILEEFKNRFDDSEQYYTTSLIIGEEFIRKAYDKGYFDAEHKAVYSMSEIRTAERDRLKKLVDDLIAKEIITAIEEGQPTSRLTSLANKFSDILKDLDTKI